MPHCPDRPSEGLRSRRGAEPTGFPGFLAAALAVEFQGFRSPCTPEMLFRTGQHKDWKQTEEDVLDA
jgi:hypothetical protein